MKYRLFFIFALASLFIGHHSNAQCDPVVAHDTSQFTADYAIRTSLVRGNTLHFAGNFTYVSQRTGHFAGIDTTFGNILHRATWPQVNGPVYKVITDGAGGWIIGGLFTAVGDSVRSNLAQIDASGHVTAFNPQTDDYVSALLLTGSTLYVGGLFTHVGGAPRSHLAKIAFPTGVVSAWAPDPDNYILALGLYNGVLYAGGTFTHVGGQPRSFIAKLDTASGAVSSWDAAPIGFSVNAIAFRGSNVYLGGSFGVIGGLVRDNIAALDTGTALANAWAPNADNTVYSLIFRSSTLYLAGRFGHLGATARNGFAEVDLTTGTATTFNPMTGLGTYISYRDMAVSGSKLFLCGSYGFGATRNYLASIDIPSATCQPRRYVLDNYAYTLGINGSELFVGGDFTGVGKERQGAAAIDMNADTLTAWNPAPNGDIVCMAASPSKIYLAGHFLTTSGSSTYRDLAAFDAVTGAADPAFLPYTVGGSVSSMVYSAGSLFIGGTFTGIGTYPRLYVGKISATTGACDPVWVTTGVTTTSAINCLALDEHNNIIIGGNFTALAGPSVRHNIGSVDPVTGIATAWNPDIPGTVMTVTVNNHKAFVGGAFTTVGGVPVKNLAKIDLTTGLADAWTPNPNQWVNVITPYYNSEFVGGRFDTIGTARVRGLGSVNLANSIPSAWDPAPDRDSLYSMAVYGNRLYALGQFRNISGGTGHYHFILYNLKNLPDTLTVTGNNSVCTGEHVLFTAATGVACNYQWTVNGVNTGVNADTFSYLPANGDIVICSNTVTATGCYISDSTRSNPITMSVNPISVPVISVMGPPAAYVGSTVGLTATISGAGSSYIVYWFKNAVLFNTTTGPTVSYVKTAGTDVITAKVVSLSGPCYDSTVSSPVPVNELHEVVIGVNSTNGVRAYPNPFEGTLTVHGLDVTDDVALLDCAGRAISEYKVDGSGTGTRTLLFDNLSPGTYMLRITDSAGHQKKTVMVVRR